MQRDISSSAAAVSEGAREAAAWVDNQVHTYSFWSAIGFAAAVGGAFSGSVGLLLIKSGGMLEGHLPWYKRRRWLLGFTLQAGMSALTDTIAYATCPLSLISPLAGLTLALSTMWAALGCIKGIHETISRAEVMTIGWIWTGVTICSISGPRTVGNGNLDKLGQYLSQPGFVNFWAIFSVAMFGWVAILELPRWPLFAALARLRPSSERLSALISALNAAGCAALTQVFLKVCALIIPYSLRRKTLPVSNMWLWASGALLALYAITQLYLLNATMAAGSVAFAVPTFSSLLVLCTVSASALFFGDFNKMSTADSQLFLLGAAFVIIGIFVLPQLQSSPPVAYPPPGDESQKPAPMTTDSLPKHPLCSRPSETTPCLSKV